MGGLALIAKQQGHHVTGSDENIYPPMSQQLIEQGIELIEGYDPKQLDPKPDQIIVGNAMKRGMPIVEHLLNENLPYTSGPLWLNENVLQNRWVIAVSGTHGKTTTTSLLTWILETCGRNPSFLIGGIPENFGISARLTDSPFFVIEADEYDSAFFDKRSKFIHYRPRTLIINNLEFDHADIFNSLADIQKQFHHLIRTVPSNGLIITPAEVPAISEIIAAGCWTPITHFSLEGNSEWSAQAIKPDGSEFTIYQNGQKEAEITWDLIGQHNMHNALAALLAASHIGIAPTDAAKALRTFKNVRRRLEVRGQPRGITVYDDFAHHPTAIATTLNGLRKKVGDQRIIAVMELGSYTMRTGVHKDQLAASLSEANHVVFLKPKENWGIEEVVNGLTNEGELLPDVDGIISQLLQITKPSDHIVIMSNGGFGNLHEKLLTALESG